MNEYNEQQVTDPYVVAQTKWVAELCAARKELEDFHERGLKIIDLYGETKKLRRVRKYPLFNANVGILENALFSRVPRPDVARRFKDPDDQVGRVAALILHRALVTELEGSTQFKTTAKSVIKDLLVPGAGFAWVRYDADVESPQLTEDTDAELAELPTASPIIKDQQTPVEYVHWRDVLWSSCRNWNECRWVARRVYLNKAEATERFGERAAYLSFDNEQARDSRRDDQGPQHGIEPLAEVWEIWDKASKRVYFICEKCPSALDIKDDFLGLPEFFPTPEPLFANVTTSALIPIADFTILQDQYHELNEVNNRISRLIRACRLAGVYDETRGEVKLLLDGAAEHQLVPVKGWDNFAAKGGLAAAIDFMSIKEIAETLVQLRQQLAAIVQQIYELTGISDIVRGASNPYETKGAQVMKAQYASIRLSGKQNDVAQYFTSLVRIKAFLMLKFYEPERLLQRCGTLTAADQQYVPAAIQLLQDELLTSLKLNISTDSLQDENWQRDTQQTSQAVTALGGLLRDGLPAATQFPELAPLLLYTAKATAASMPGGAEIEGVIEMTLTKLANAGQQQKPPSPQEQAAQAAEQRAHAQFQLEQAQAQADMQAEQAKMQMQAQKQADEKELEQQRLQMQSEFERQKLQLEAQKIAAELDIEKQKLQLELMKLEVEKMKLQVKQAPQVVLGNTGIEEDRLAEVMSGMQSSIDALTALASAPPEPAQVRVTRNADGELIGTIQ